MSTPAPKEDLAAKKRTKRNPHARLLKAMEQLLSQEREQRQRGLGRIIASGAHRRFPATAALLVTCLDEDDIDLRTTLVLALGQSLAREGSRRSVRAVVRRRIARLSNRELRALLTLAATHPELFEPVCFLLDVCSRAGNVMLAILCDPAESFRQRQAAAQIIARVGFLEVLPTLERFYLRLQNAQPGQLRMPFANRPDPHAERLQPIVRSALAILQESAR